MILHRCKNKKIRPSNVWNISPIQESCLFMEMKDYYVYFNLLVDHFGVNRTVLNFDINFYKVAILRLIEKIRIFTTLYLENMPEHSFIVFILQNFVSFLSSFYLFSIEMHRRAIIHAYVIFSNFL